MTTSPDLQRFMQSLERDAEPGDALAPELKALWWARRDDWHRAHDLLQDLPSSAASRVHAYLHRVEGDLDNANYWYRTAGVASTTVSLDEEWSALVSELVQASADSALR